MKKITFTIILTIYLIIILSTTVFGATPKLVNKLNSAFENIESWIIKISTPAAAVAVCFEPPIAPDLKRIKLPHVPDPVLRGRQRDPRFPEQETLPVQDRCLL